MEVLVRFLTQLRHLAHNLFLAHLLIYYLLIITTVSSHKTDCKCKNESKVENNSASNYRSLEINIPNEIIKNDGDKIAKPEVKFEKSALSSFAAYSHASDTRWENLKKFKHYNTVHLFGPQDHSWAQIQNGDDNNLGRSNFDVPSLKNEILLLGNILEPFKGPRRRKKRNTSHKNAQNYFKNSQTSFSTYGLRNEFKINNTPKLIHIQSNVEKTLFDAANSIANERTDINLDKSLKKAWESYGDESHPVFISKYPSRSFTETTNFQPSDSEWSLPKNRPLKNVELDTNYDLIGKYVRYEVNNYVISDSVRALIFSFFVGTAIFLWILLGFWLKILSWPLTLFKQKIEGKSEGGSYLSYGNNSILDEISERVSLGLDGDWLKKLEERVMGDAGRNLLKTSVSCCILPQSETAECEVVRKARKISKFKCLSDLIYNFQFGPQNN